MKMSVTEMATAASRVAYKPGWKFEIYEGEWEGPHVAITAAIPNAYDINSPIVLNIHSPIPPMRDETALHEWLMWRLGRIEIHEMREFYRVDGVCVDDPHGESAGRDKLDYMPPVLSQHGK